MSSAGLLSRPLPRDSHPPTENWPAQFRPVLTKLVAGGREYFGSDEISVEPLTRVERPFSTLLKIRVGTGGCAQGAFVKILKPRADTPVEIASMQRNVQRDFEMTARVRHALGGCAGLTAVRPIACFPEELAIVTGEAVGPMLSQVLARRAAGWPRPSVVRELSQLLYRVGAWLKAAQDALPEDHPLDREAMRTYLDKRFTDLETTGAIRLTTSGRDAIARCRDRLLRDATAEGLRRVWIHADFCPENIITRGGDITVLDFMMAKTGTKYHDLAHLFMHLEAMQVKPWFRPAIVARLQRDLMAGFEPGLTVGRPLFALMLLQHVVCHLLTLQAPVEGRAARLYRARLHGRHRRWLAEVAGLGNESWIR